MQSSKAAIREAISNWWIFLISGVLFIALSFLVLSNPGISYRGLTIYFAILFLLHGIFEIVFFLSNRKKLHSGEWYLIIGIFDLVIGFILIWNPLFAAVIVTIFIGFWLMFKSGSMIVRALELKNTGMNGWGLLLTAGILGVLFSFFILLNPEIGAGTLVLLTTLALLTIGIFFISLGLKLKNAHTWSGNSPELKK